MTSVNTQRTRLYGHNPPAASGGAGGGCLILFSLPFIAVGVFVILLSLGFFPALENGRKAPTQILTIFGAVFSIAGLGVWGLGVRAIFRNRASIRRREEHPLEPWLGDYPWDARGADSGGIGSALSGFAVFAFLALFLSMFNWLVFLSNEKDVPFFAKAIVGFFDLIALLVLGSAFYQLFQYLKYGSSRLHFARFPFRPGSSLEAGLEANARILRAPTISLTLRYIEEEIVVTSSGSKTSSTVQLHSLHEITQELNTSMFDANSGSEIPINIRLPEGDFSTNLSGSPRRYWELDVKAETPGIDYAARFLIPVYSADMGTAR